MKLVLVAGLWLDGGVWDEVVPLLEGHGVEGVPLTLPGQGDGAVSATYHDQLAAVLAAVDAVPADEEVVVVGHSAAATLAWAAGDARVERISGVVLVGGVPVADGTAYADLFEPDGDVVPFPGWEPFEGPDIADLDETMRRDLAARTVPMPVTVTRGRVDYRDARRRELSAVLVCPEFTPEQAREWIASGVPELQDARNLRLVDLDSGHWPMTSRPRELAEALAEAARSFRGTSVDGGGAG